MSPSTLPGPARPDEDLDEEDASGGRMSFLDHLDELRRRIIYSLSAVVVGFLVAFAFIDRIFAFIMRPLQAVLPNGGKLVYTEPAEAFMLYMKVAALVGLILALPVVLYQLWMFVAPGLLLEREAARHPLRGLRHRVLRRRRPVLPLRRVPVRVAVLRAVHDGLHDVHAAHPADVLDVRAADAGDGRGVPAAHPRAVPREDRARHARLPVEEHRSTPSS